MIDFIRSWFTLTNPWGLALAVAFGAVWLACYWPPLKRFWLWVVLVVSAFLTLAAVAFIQIPLQTLVGQLLGNFWSQPVLLSWLLLAAIPQILLSGLVQEGAKMVPMAVWWWRKERHIDPGLGLFIGAMAGAGFGVYEAVWAHGQILAAGWTWPAVQNGGLMALVSFWERFVIVAFHISVSALAGYGLAKGKGWQLYLIAAALHSLLNYSAVLYRSGTFNIVAVEIYAAIITALVMATALRRRWLKPEQPAEPEPSAG
ncbi:MAG: hypothetical protein A2144_02565 [Chloroflexi bacterium RBG_16_50_9]|nr:MAG: hypothetical protein A2144_02565 [Chloroflexi bacterium RBG_16_50_9]